MNNVLVKFTRPNSPYNKGEIAGFSAETAKRFCEGKQPVAVYYKPVPEVVPEVGEPDAGAEGKSTRASRKK